MTEDNKDLIQGKDLLVAYYDVDYEKNAKGSNYWRNRYAAAGGSSASLPSSLHRCCSIAQLTKFLLLFICEFFSPRKLPAEFLVGTIGVAAACRAQSMQYVYPLKPHLLAFGSLVLRL